MKTLIVGIDGATFDLIRPWAAQGRLPTLNRLMTQGTWGRLESTIPPMTSPAWPSFATGKYPARHGIFDFVSAHAGNYNIVNATAIKASPLWDILSAQGQRVGVINVPVTYPPHPVNGFMITGLLSPANAEITYPPDLLTRSNGGEDRYRVMPVIQYKPGNEQAFIRDLLALIDTRARYAIRLLKQHPVDFMMVHFLATDIAQHALWRFADPNHPRHEPGNPFQNAIYDVYRRVDDALGRLLEQIDRDTTVIVMSDHGFGPLHNVVNLNMLLLEKGLLHLKRDPLTRFRAFLFKNGLTPSAVYRWLARFNLQNLVSRVSKSTRNAVFGKFLSFDDIDWSRTTAYSLGHIGQIYINRTGREPHGIVRRGADYDRACDQVIEALTSLATPDGRPMLSRVIRKQALAGGPYADQGPDLHVVLDEYRYISCPLFATDGNVIRKQIRGDSGCHRRHGILIARGPHIRPGSEVQNARIVDLAPTTLHLMGHAVPAGMDGRVLHDLFTPAFLSAHPVHAETIDPPAAQDLYALSSAEEAELESSLKGLGYLG